MRDSSIKALKSFFEISIAVFDFQKTVIRALGQESVATENFNGMYELQKEALKEVNKEKPDSEKIEVLLLLMDVEIKKKS